MAATWPASEADLEEHEASTTDVHGIPDTSVLATVTDVSDEADAREAADAALQTAVDGKQDASTAATDAELAAGLALKQDAATAATDAELAAGLALKQDAATAATDAELAAEASARSAADTSEASARSSADTTLTAAAAAAQATGDAALPKAGGTMTGKIVLDGDPTASLHPATRQYVLAQITALINGAPGTLDTLKEIADQLGSDESAVAALTLTVAGKLAAASNLSDLANAVTARSNLGLGSAATHPAGDFDSSGAAAAAQAASQPLDSDLTALAALTTTSFGRSLLELANAAAGRTAFGLGNVDNTSDANKPVSTAQQTALDAKVTGPSSATDGDSVRFDGAGGKLIKRGPHDFGIVTALPTSPTPQTGDFCVLTDSLSAPTYYWQCVYNGSDSGSYKWAVIGGSPLFNQVATEESTASDSYTAVGFTALTVVLPNGGDYFIGHGFWGYNSVGVGAMMSYDIGATAAVDADSADNDIPSGTNSPRSSVSFDQFKTGLAAVTLTAKYKRRTAAGTAFFGKRWMRAMPKRIG